MTQRSVQRQLPNPAEILELMRFKAPEFDGTKRRLEGALTISDLRTIAKRRTPKAAFDYTDGAAEDEISIARARQAFRHEQSLLVLGAACFSENGAWLPFILEKLIISANNQIINN